MADAKPFIGLLRRASHCGYPTLMMHNRMLMQCYNVNDDGETGLHYVLHVPDDERYDSGIYSKDFILNVRDVLAAYTKGHRAMEEVRKERGEKPKSLTEEVKLRDSELVFTFILHGLEDISVDTVSVSVEHPIDPRSPVRDNIEQTYSNLMDRIRIGGACLLYDGLRFGLQRHAMDCPEVYHFVAKYHGKRVRIPLMKSMFGGIKELDRFYISIQESSIERLYVYSLSLMKNGITETYWGYLIQY